MYICTYIYVCLIHPKAFVWGLNDRGQLGSELSEAKVKVPFESRALAKLRPIQFVGGAKTLFIISQDGKVHVYNLSFSDHGSVEQWGLCHCHTR
jgi:alpha-tubulin suppressor-like RCC1 family protein